MTTENQAVTLRIGVFFDGTGNNRGNAVKGERPLSPEATGSYACALSNVALLYDAYGVGETTLSLYVEGPGTVEGEEDSTVGWYTGIGETGVRARVEQAGTRLAAQVGDWLQARPEVQLQALHFDLFGFSRGAAGARDLANDLRKGAASLLASAAAQQPTPFAPGLGWHDGIGIRFIGLFDTVGAIVEPWKFNFTPTMAITAISRWAWRRMWPMRWCNWWRTMNTDTTTRWSPPTTTSACPAHMPTWAVATWP